MLPLVAVFAVHSAGCDLLYYNDATDFEPTERQCHPVAPEIDPAAQTRHYVIDTMDIPESVEQATELGLDLDGDGDARVDNRLGQILSVFVDQGGGYDLDAEQAALIESGAILHLLEVQATVQDPAFDVGVTLMHGQDTDGDPSDNLGGGETFAIDTAIGQGTMHGCIEDGLLDVQRGTVPVAITFPGLEEPFIVDVVAARIEAQIDNEGLTGIIAGAILETDVDQEVIPVLAEGLGRVVARDCMNGTCTGFGELLIDLFDADQSGDIDADELRSNSLIGTLFAPDVDLFNSNGAYDPRSDGVEDSLSIGVGFTAVPAAIQ